MHTEPTRLKGRLRPVQTPSGEIRLVLASKARFDRELRRGRTHHLAGLGAIVFVFAIGIVLGVLACCTATRLTRHTHAARIGLLPPAQ